ncbi:MAG TPA: SUMF1/EgtB/PvdO family nonheme iron enzyme [Roseiflexaceae bacterium]|nr:SUMF1/EgtB/PvdO family nonheme iron enzyme [Roseiflexaceae bacterium]
MPDSSALPAMAVYLGGMFRMGTPEDRLDDIQRIYGVRHRDMFEPEVPEHDVELAPFAIDKRLVTNAQFHAFLLDQPAWRPGRIAAHLHNGEYLKHWQGDNYPPDLADHPVVYVCWYAALAYAQWANKRLPSEAEWEYAARGGQPEAEFPWGTAAPDPGRANYGASGIEQTTPVGSYPPNPYGIYDLAGNVWEYCLDAWDANYYANSPRHNPIAGEGWDMLADPARITSRRVIRGGSWGGSPVNLRVAYRDSHPPTGAGPHVGFRCAQSLPDLGGLAT